MKNDPGVRPLETKRISRLSCAIVALTVAIALVGEPQLAAQDSCKPVEDAMNKIYTVPSHLYSTMDGNHKNEIIYASGVIYDNLHGKWARSSVTLQRVMELDEKNRRNSRTSCHYLRDEAVNGEMASVYSTHAERTDMELKSEGQVWISKARGLMLRQEEDVDAGDRFKNHHSTRYEYNNVGPPL